MYITCAIKTALFSEVFFIFNKSGKIFSNLESMFFLNVLFVILRALIFLDAYVLQN